MISRHWKGIAKPREADNYIKHLRTDTFPKLAKIKGFISASILRRPVEQGTDFLIITVWESIEAIERFAGAKADVAVVPESVQAMMIEYDRNVSHYEVVEE
ncbi:MAG: antibiotic biosynthesis monooxygenase family protein [Desulfomonilaceae bacterium]